MNYMNRFSFFVLAALLVVALVAAQRRLPGWRIAFAAWADIANGSRACSALTKSMFGWTDAFCQANPYDPDAAGAILDEAGWVMNDETGIRERDGAPLTPRSSRSWPKKS